MEEEIISSGLPFDSMVITSGRIAAYTILPQGNLDTKTEA